MCILSSIADSCPVELAAKLSETHRNPAVEPDAPSCRVVVKKVSKTPVASGLRIVACSCVPRIRCRPPPSSSTSPCPKRVDAVVHAHQPGVDSRDRMREPKGSGHTTPLRTRAQTAGKSNGDTTIRKKSAGDQGRQQPPVLLDGRRRAPVEISRKMRQPTKCDLQRRGSAPPVTQQPRPAYCHPRSTAGSDVGVARGDQPPPWRQQGRAAQRHHRRRPHRSSAAVSHAPSQSRSE